MLAQKPSAPHGQATSAAIASAPHSGTLPTPSTPTSAITRSTTASQVSSNGTAAVTTQQSDYVVWKLKAADVISSFSALVSLFSAVVAIAAVWGSLNAFVIYPNRIKKLEMRLKLVEDQLIKLYGPLLAESTVADSTFRRLELTFHTLNAKHRHYDLRAIRSEDFKEHAPLTMSPDVQSRRLFANFIVNGYLPFNKKRMEIIQHNLDLLGTC